MRQGPSLRPRCCARVHKGLARLHCAYRFALGSRDTWPPGSSNRTRYTVASVGPAMVAMSLITSMGRAPEKFVRTEHMESFNHPVVHNGWADRLRVGLET